jgi:hypothetical protein
MLFNLPVNYLSDLNFLYPKAIINKKKFITTIIAPVGILRKKEINIPLITAIMDVIAEIIIVILNPLATCNAVTEGNIINAEISIMPTTLIERTTVIAVSTTSIMLMILTFMPATLACSSLKVMEKRS